MSSWAAVRADPPPCSWVFVHFCFGRPIILSGDHHLAQAAIFCGSRHRRSCVPASPNSTVHSLERPPLARHLDRRSQISPLFSSVGRTCVSRLGNLEAVPVGRTPVSQLNKLKTVAIGRTPVSQLNGLKTVAIGRIQVSQFNKLKTVAIGRTPVSQFNRLERVAIAPARVTPNQGMADRQVRGQVAPLARCRAAAIAAATTASTKDASTTVNVRTAPGFIGAAGVER
ncbi:hypothetical protein AB0C29_30375 [Actinoplanes sp. NPDC048791]|uniref:hypothetical protein n=1 Tax=Actinoplanes sp. NPDC048791 TaxID=3154623 RepID=UPI0033E1CFA6